MGYRKLSSNETKTIEILKSFGLESARFFITDNMLEKSTLTASLQVRTILKKSNIHDYSTQDRGVKNKKYITAYLIQNTRTIPLTTSLYIPGTKAVGERRIWPYGLKEHCSPGEIVILFVMDKRLYFLNSSTINPDELIKFLRQNLLSDTIKEDLNSIDLEEERFEGKKKSRHSNYYERLHRNREDAIRIHGLKCIACEFDFEKKYGERGAGFIEVHHLKPLGEQDYAILINPKDDLTVVCSNCHRMIHRRKDQVLTIDELKAIIKGT